MPAMRQCEGHTVAGSYYRCNSCGTEFYLDNDDININIRQQQAPVTPVNKKQQLVFGLLAGMVGLMFFIPTLFRTGKKDKAYDFKIPFSFSDMSIVPYKNEKNELEYAILGLHQKGPDRENSGYELISKVYNSAGKLLKETTYDKVFPQSHRVDSEISFEDSTKYMIINEKEVYRFDAPSRTFQYLNDDWIKKPELAAGIAKLNRHSDWGYFDVVTLSGIKIPLLYPCRRYYQVRQCTQVFGTPANNITNNPENIFFRYKKW